MRSAASVRQIGGVLISRACLKAVQDLWEDGLQPAGALETISAVSMRLYEEKSDHGIANGKRKAPPQRSFSCLDFLNFAKTAIFK